MFFMKHEFKEYFCDNVKKNNHTDSRNTSALIIPIWFAWKCVSKYVLLPKELEGSMTPGTTLEVLWRLWLLTNKYMVAIIP